MPYVSLRQKSEVQSVVYKQYVWNTGLTPRYLYRKPQEGNEKDTNVSTTGRISPLEMCT